MQFVSLGPIYNICSYNKLTPTRQNAVTLANGDTVHWLRYYALQPWTPLTDSLSLTFFLIFLPLFPLSLAEQLSWFITFGIPGIRRPGYVIKMVADVQ